MEEGKKEKETDKDDEKEEEEGEEEDIRPSSSRTYKISLHVDRPYCPNEIFQCMGRRWRRSRKRTYAHPLRELTILVCMRTSLTVPTKYSNVSASDTFMLPQCPRYVRLGREMSDLR